jgi:hypothetical protein
MIAKQSVNGRQNEMDYVVVMARDCWMATCAIQCDGVSKRQGK